MMNIYFAGAITVHFRNDEMHKATEWRKEIGDWCDDQLINYFDPAKTFVLEQNKKFNTRLCVDQNRYYLDQANIMVVNLEDVLLSPGTIWELTYASEVRKIPVLAFGKPSWSPHIMNCISHRFDKLEETIEALCTMFQQNM